MKRKIILTFLTLIVAATLVAGGFYVGIYIGEKRVVCKVCKPEEIDFSLFWESWKVLQENFVNKEKFDVQKMIYGAISGMVDSLGDPYTVFMPPEDAKKFIDDVKKSEDPSRDCNRDEKE